VPISNCNPLAQKQSGHVKNSLIGITAYFSIAYENTSRTGEEGGNHFSKQRDRGENNLWVFWCHILEVNYELGKGSREKFTERLVQDRLDSCTAEGGRNYCHFENLVRFAKVFSVAAEGGCAP